ncbi:MAG TPA: lipoprotein [Novosphingobium sp.]|nr:lipoprotein [Novosphingobium sp.]
MRGLAIIALALALAGCGNKAALEPKTGQALPPAPYGSEDRRSADTLLTPPVQAIPERSAEIRRRSEERQDDPFDLPPPE